MNDQESVNIDLLCIGHVCHDKHDSSYILGGTASYASMMGAHMGIATGIVTSVGSDFLFLNDLLEKGICTEIIPARRTTEFENIYTNEGRIQYMHARASVITSRDIPKSWLAASTVKFCLIADEVADDVITLFEDSFVAATIQGWLRTWDENGLVIARTIDMSVLQGIDMIFLSEDDIGGDEKLLNMMKDSVDTVVMTRGDKPAVIYRGKTELEFPVYPVNEVDPTGAGDIFATCFLVHYRRTNSIVLAAAYAHSAASFVVEHLGVYLPPIRDIELRYASYLEQFIS